MAKRGNGAGSYWQRATVYARTTEAADGTGHKRPTFTESGTYWCYTQEAKAQRQLAYAITNSVVEVQVHFRGYPQVAALDRIRVDGSLLEPKGILYDYDAGETIAVCRRIPTLDAS